MEDGVLFSSNCIWFYNMLSERSGKKCVEEETRQYFCGRFVTKVTTACNFTCNAFCHVCMARNWGMQKSSVYSGSTNDRPHLCAVVDTLMFLWLELMIFILTPESVSWELLCSSLGMNFPVLFTFQDALTQNLNILVHFFS